VNNGQEIVITYRGKAFAKIVPIKKEISGQGYDFDNELFCLWKNREDVSNVDRYVRNMRKGRKLC
jgi:antitoxin (DNA-binding transcriptional repressor) of toxin-antitoxin stability system